MTDLPAWLVDNPRPPSRPTEIFLPLCMGIGPVWSHDSEKGGWYARLTVPPMPEWWECDHIHPTKDEAWTCATDAAQQVAEEALK